MSVIPDREQIKAEIVGTFGFFPPFFEPALITPGILENLWRQTLVGYVNNPLPAVFKETLFARLSPYCNVPYGIVCHPCVLRPMGLTTAQMLELLEASQIQNDEDPHEQLQWISAEPGPLADWPMSDSLVVMALLRCAEMVYLSLKATFIQTNPERFGAELKRILGPIRYAHAISFLAYVKTCHLWVEAHAELAYEADKQVWEHLQPLLRRDSNLANFFRGYPEKVRTVIQERVARQEVSIEHQRAQDSQMQLAASIASSDEGIISAALDGTILSWNKAAESVYGYSAEEALGRSIFLMVPPEHLDETAKLMEQIKDGGRVAHHETISVRKDGQRIDVAVTLSPLKDATGKVVGISRIARDITVQKQREDLLKISEACFRRLFETAQDGILILDKETGQIREVNPYLINLLGYSREEFLDKKLWEIGAFSDQTLAKTAFEELQRNGYVRYEDLPLQTKDGHLINVEFVSNVYPVDHKNVIQCNIRNITERKRAEQALNDLNNSLEKRTSELAHANADLGASAQELRKANERLEQLAMVDPLTRLLNRRGLQRMLSQEIQRSKREGASCFALLVDLDNFKQINDALGLTVGDMALTQIAEQLRSCLRATDHAGRIGGDEFIVLLPATSAVKAILIAEKLRLAVSGTSILDYPTSSATVTASLGLVEVNDASSSVEELLAQAQSILKKSKDGGKNRVSYDESIIGGKNPEMRDSWDALLATLRRGDAFRVARQAIFSLGDMKVVGYEALSRLDVKDFEMPDDFFRIALQANILTLVDHHCFKACIAAASSAPPEIRWHLNIFPSTLANIPVQDLLAVFPLERRGTFCIEISEQQVMSDLSHLIEVVGTLKQAGLLIAMDDVGFGRSSLESLILLQPQIVKIDKSWVLGVGRESARMQTLSKVMQVVRAIGAEAVAEGIETSEDLEVLQKLGVTYGQGYLLGKPAEIDGVPEG